MTATATVTMADKRATARMLRRNPSPAERLLWSRLRCNRFDDLKFRRQAIISGYIVDFWCPGRGIVIECGSHVDAVRDANIRSNPRCVAHLRFSPDDVLADPDAIIEKIRAAVKG